MARDASTLPGWIPLGARFVYSDTGPYTDSRREQAISGLFHDSGLEDFFLHLDGCLASGEWEYFVGCIVDAVECVPEGGAATRDRPDNKTRVRDKQTRASALLSKISDKARELARLLDELDELRATVPAETYSCLALIESALSRNPAEVEFDRFRRSLSSYQEHGFPAPADLLNALANASDANPPAAQIFADDPWLASQKSTWRDFVRIVADSLSDIYVMHGVKIELREKHWLSLTRALVSPDISRSSVNAELRKLPPFSWESRKK